MGRTLEGSPELYTPFWCHSQCVARSLVLPDVLEWTAIIETGTLNKCGQGHGFKVGKLDPSQLLCSPTSTTLARSTNPSLNLSFIVLYNYIFVKFVTGSCSQFTRYFLYLSKHRQVSPQSQISIWDLETVCHPSSTVTYCSSPSYGDSLLTRQHHESTGWTQKLKHDSRVSKVVSTQPYTKRESEHLHAQLSRITAIVRLCYSIGQLVYPSIHAGEKIGLLGRSMSYPGTLGGAVPISTSGNRNTSG